MHKRDYWCYWHNDKRQGLMTNVKAVMHRLVRLFGHNDRVKADDAH